MVGVRAHGLLDIKRRRPSKVDASVYQSVRDLVISPPDPDIRLSEYGRRWVERKERAGLRCGPSYRTNLRHWIKLLSDPEVREIRRSAVAGAIAALRQTTLAPRTIHRIHDVLRGLLDEAVEEGLLETNPVLRRKDLPKARDRDGWDRSRAVFDHAEVENLISDARIDHWRRIVYAICFLSGLRLGELAALRWSAYDPSERPLGRITIFTGYSRATKREGPPKTGVFRPVPVHAALARLLDEWRHSGWRRAFGRDPRDDDFVVPRLRQNGKIDRLLTGYVWTLLQQDLRVLGLRRRRAHDSRKTFLSLGVADGGRLEVLRRATHARPSDIENAYLEIWWTTLCEEVALIKILGRGIQLDLGFT